GRAEAEPVRRCLEWRTCAFRRMCIHDVTEISRWVATVGGGGRVRGRRRRNPYPAVIELAVTRSARLLFRQISFDTSERIGRLGAYSGDHARTARCEKKDTPLLMTESHVPAVAGAEPARDLVTPATVATGPAQARFSAQKPAGRGADVPAIELVDVVKGFHARRGEITAGRELDLAIREGEFFSLLGPSGCGKTTTMRMIAGFEEPTRGGIRLHGADVTGIPPNKRDVNMVFQSYALFPHMTVFENVAFGLRRKKA